MAAFSDSSSTSSWVKFFTEGGIPHNVAANYAVTFVDNRIAKNMLLDLNKEILHDMGISVMGDIIAILKHAKVVHAQMTRDKVYQEESPVVPIPPARRSTPVTRILDHYTQQDSQSPPSLADKATLKRKFEEEIPIPKVRRVFPEQEGPYKITIPAGNMPKTKQLIQQKAAAQKSSVFGRLALAASTTPAVKLSTKVFTTQDSPTMAASVFARLGPGRGQVSSTTTHDVEEIEADSQYAPLEYHGIFKPSQGMAKVLPTKGKVPLITSVVSSKAAVRKIPLSKRLGPKVNPTQVHTSTMLTGPKVKRVIQANTISSCSEGILATGGVSSSTKAITVKSRLGGMAEITLKPKPQSKTNLVRTVSGAGVRLLGSNLAKNMTMVSSTSLSRTLSNKAMQKTLTVRKPILKKTIVQNIREPAVSFSTTSNVFSRLGPSYD